MSATDISPSAAPAVRTGRPWQRDLIGVAVILLAAIGGYVLFPGAGLLLNHVILPTAE